MWNQFLNPGPSALALLSEALHPKDMRIFKAWISCLYKPKVTKAKDIRSRTRQLGGLERSSALDFACP
jgi:hypothetical protein